MKSRVRDATKGRPVSVILGMALPLLAGNIFQNLYSVVDTAVVGRYVGIRALAAVGNTGWLHYMIMSIIIGVTQGAGIHIANRFGAKDGEGLRRSVAALFALSALLAAAMTLVVQLLLRPALVLLKFDAEIIGLAESYLRICFAAIPVIVAYNALDIAIRSMGDTRTPFIAMSTGAVTNIVLDVVLIAWAGMGVEGAAAATVAGQIASVCVCLPTVLRMRDAYMPSRSHYRSNMPAVRTEVRLAVPLALQHSITAAGGLFVTHAINGFGVSFVAAFTATERLYGLMEMSGIAIGYAFSVFVSQNLGARLTSRIRSASVRTALAAGGISVAIALLLILFGKSVLSLFIDSADPASYEQTLGTAYRYLRIMCSWLPVLYLLHVFRSGLNGLRDTVTPMASGILEFAVRAFMTGFAAPRWGEAAILRTEPMAWLAAAVLLTLVYFLRQRALGPDGPRAGNI